MKQGILIRLASLLLVGVVALPSAFSADTPKHPPDLADVTQGYLFWRRHIGFPRRIPERRDLDRDANR